MLDTRHLPSLYRAERPPRRCASAGCPVSSYNPTDVCGVHGGWTLEPPEGPMTLAMRTAIGDAIDEILEPSELVAA